MYAIELLSFGNGIYIAFIYLFNYIILVNLIDSDWLKTVPIKH
jgi:hypothetical protein